MRIGPTLRVVAAIAALFSGSYAHAADQSSDAVLAKMLDRCSGISTDDCIVRQFKDTPEASVIRGKIVYQNYCVLCHGVSGKGDGRAARIHNPRPANLTQSGVPPEYLAQIIRKGGEAMGRSPDMPPWGDQLTDEQIRDLINHLLSIRKQPQ